VSPGAGASTIEVLEAFDVVRVKAANPSLLTLDGTNTWVLGRDPAWVVDPGPALGAHLDAVAEVVAARGGAGGIAVTHGHADHTEAVEPLRAATTSATASRCAPSAGPGSTTHAGSRPSTHVFVPSSVSRLGLAALTRTTSNASSTSIVLAPASGLTVSPPAGTPAR